jgi:hypothetical protein
MFCPFFVQTGLCEAFAKMIYNSESEELPVETNSFCQSVKVDLANSSKNIKVTENRMGSKITYNLRGKGKSVGDI